MRITGGASAKGFYPIHRGTAAGSTRTLVIPGLLILQDGEGKQIEFHSVVGGENPEGDAGKRWVQIGDDELAPRLAEDVDPQITPVVGGWGSKPPEALT